MRMRVWSLASLSGLRIWHCHVGQETPPAEHGGDTDAENYSRMWKTGVPIKVPQKQIWIGTIRLGVQSLALLSGSRIWHCNELWCRLQMWLRSGIAVDVALSGSYSSDSTASLEISICHMCGPKKEIKSHFFFFFVFLGLHLWHMEVLRLGV